VLPYPNLNRARERFDNPHRKASLVSNLCCHLAQVNTSIQ
jgi:hypothetical protein